MVISININKLIKKMMTLNPMMPKMMMAAKIEVAQFVKATMHASLIMMIMIIVFKVSFKIVRFLLTSSNCW